MAELSTSTNKIYLSINGNGKLARKATEGTPGAVKNVFNAGTPEEKTVWQLEYASIKGCITGISYNTHEQYGESMSIVIDDEYCLQLKAGSRYYYSFVKAVPNVDLSKPVKFNPWRKEVEGKIKAALYLNQDGSNDSIPWYFTKEQPNGMPEMKKMMFKGKEAWDDTELQAFCKQYMTKNIIPKLAGSRPGGVQTGALGTMQHDPSNASAGGASFNPQEHGYSMQGDEPWQNAEDDLPF